MHDRYFTECEDCELEECYEEVECNYDNQTKITSAAKCPDCGSDITFEGGCNVCKNCGWSKCD